MIQRKYINKPDKLKYPSAFDKKRSTDFEIISEKIWKIFSNLLSNRKVGIF